MAENETPQPTGDGPMQTSEPAAGKPMTEKPAARPKVAETKPAARPAGTLAGVGTGGHGVVVVKPPEPVATLPTLPGMPALTRRGVLRIGFWAGLGAMLTGIVATILNTLYPRGVTGFGGKVFVGTVDQLIPGTFIRNIEGQAWVMRLDADQARRETEAAARAGLGYEVPEGAIMALWHKCPHLGCTVPWRDDYSREDPRTGESYSGWFLCPCHGSTYSPAGVRVFGPAPRSMDMFAVSIEGGNITVDTGAITAGSVSNPQNAVLPT